MRLSLSLADIDAEIRRRQEDARRRELESHAQEIRERCRTFTGFVKEAWHVLEPATPYVHNWHIDLIGEHLEAVHRGELNRVLFNVPPGTMKSLLISVLFQAWEWGPGGSPYLRYLSTSHNDKYVTRDTRKTRDLVASEWYQMLWGDTVRLKRSGETSFENTAFGTREGVAFTSLTGGRGHRVIIDDPHSTEKAESDKERETATRIFRESVPTRVVDPASSAIIIIMQRLHQADVSGVAMDLKLGYTEVVLPMEFEPDHPHVCNTRWGKDPRTQPGELLFPARYPREVVERDKVPLGSYGVAGQFQQRPAPREGGMFKKHWFEIVNAAPAGGSPARGWDLAATDAREAGGAEAAYTAGVRMKRVRGVFYVEDVRRDKLSGAGVETFMLNTARQDGVGVPIDFPQDPGQAGKSQAKYLAGRLAGYRVHYSPETGDKVTRAEAFAAQAEAGNVKLVKGPWNDDYINELALFPGGKYKDQVDASSRAFHRVLQAPAGIQTGTTVGSY